jgi:hypothetical protein
MQLSPFGVEDAHSSGSEYSRKWLQQFLTHRHFRLKRQKLLC